MSSIALEAGALAVLPPLFGEVTTAAAIVVFTPTLLRDVSAQGPLLLVSVDL